MGYEKRIFEVDERVFIKLDGYSKDPQSLYEELGDQLGGLSDEELFVEGPRLLYPEAIAVIDEGLLKEHHHGFSYAADRLRMMKLLNAQKTPAPAPSITGVTDAARQPQQR